MATIQKRGKGQYRVMIRRQGCPPQTATFGSRAEAANWARGIESQLDKGIVLDTREAGRTSLSEALDRYLREITPGKRGQQAERSRIGTLKASELAARTLLSLRGGDVASYRDKRLADGLSANSVRLELAIVSHLYRIATTEWKMEGLVNPVAMIRKPKPARARDRRFKEGEEALLLKAQSPLREAIILAVETAMRRGEICTLTRDQIDRKRRVARLDMTKNGDAREVPLSTRAIEIIETLPLRVDRLLLGVTADWLSHAFIDHCKAVGIKGLHFHDARREAISRLFERGFSIMEVKEISGHKTLQMLTTYTRLKADDLVKKLA